MPSETFNEVCDNLASNLDPVGHEDRRFHKEEGAKLQQVSVAIEQLFAQRHDFSIERAAKQPTGKGAIAYSIMLGDSNVANLIVRISGGSISVYAMETDDGAGDVPTNIPPAKIGLNDITPETIETVVDYAVAEAMKGIRVHG